MQIKKDRKKALFIFLLKRFFLLKITLLPSGFVFAALSCEPQLHNDILISSDALVFKYPDNLVRIEASGDLYLNVKPVALDELQRTFLSQYNQMIRFDFSYLQKRFQTQLKRSWAAFDRIIVAELSEDSSLRHAVKNHYLEFEKKMERILVDQDKRPFFDHKALRNMQIELRASLPIFLQMISMQGLSDIAQQSAGKTNKLAYMSNKLNRLQDLLTKEMLVQRDQGNKLYQDVCQRLLQWQAQEQIISRLVPALADLKTVSLN